ncbi:hypothetical protein [Microbacterium sp. 77mftsu3.1]|uniref:hypothetical protein n=1 Tax=Microbacterium sp. 77mftsu3.1 TaxID=1761802 RepID=UPI00058F54C4|nr:hypothetical protein [Microbacterium sp. 77mftsu3.1]SDH34451.1 hypothetical protein SAMN04488590_3085 [Microbacterium sp. 77mftsu3.1]
MSDMQPRENNGQYGEKPHSYPEVVLAETVDGSFLFPPSEWPGGAAQYVEFWTTQPISDEALTNFASCYAQEWDSWAVPIVREHLELWGNSNEGRAAIAEAAGDNDRLRKARLAEHDRFMDELRRGRPDRIPGGLVRKVARAAQIMQNRIHLRDQHDRESVANTELHESQDGSRWTAHNFWDRYQLEELMPDMFYSRENALIRQLRMSSRG